MRFIKLFITLATAMLFFLRAYNQTDTTCHLRISLLTCSPGQELYSTFGHTGIRVTDTVTGMDVVFNYGTFDDSDPYFYFKFTRGIMRYALSVQTFNDFLQEYVEEKRGVIEQQVRLDCKQQQQLFEALRINAREENRFYNYLFHEDNCTTRAKDMVSKKAGATVIFNNILPPTAPTFRQLIHEYLDKGKEPWNKFGIDILLGANLDKHAGNEQAMFLPDYLMKGFDNATINGLPLVEKKQFVLHRPKTETTDASWFTPMVFTVALLVLIGLLSFNNSRWAQRITGIFDAVFFLTLGLLGILLLILWIIRVDDVCSNNFNLLWALPTHLPMVFMLRSRKNFVRKYFSIAGWLCIALLAAWFLLPQQLNPAIIPLVVLIIVRCFRITQKKRA